LIDSTIHELRLAVDDRDELFGPVLEAAGGDSIALDSVCQQTSAAISAALRNL
jgi:hypothetical protein